MLRLYGSRFALLAQATDELGLGGSRDGTGVNDSSPGLPSLGGPVAGQVDDLSAYLSSGGGSKSMQLPAPLTAGAEGGEGGGDGGEAAMLGGEPRASVSEGVKREANGGGVMIGMDALP